MPTGTLKWFNSDKGYGFIAPDGGGDDVFVHESSMDSTCSRDDGAKLEFEIKAGNKGPKATNVKGA
jgi:CspA family cold shock protein